MIDQLKKQWSELHTDQPPRRTVGEIQEFTGKEIEILEALKKSGCQDEIDGFSIQFGIDDRRRTLREMHERLSDLLG